MYIHHFYTLNKCAKRFIEEQIGSSLSLFPFTLVSNMTENNVFNYADQKNIQSSACCLISINLLLLLLSL